MNELFQAVNQALEQDKKNNSKTIPCCAVQIFFYHNTFIDEVKLQLTPLVGEFTRHDDSLFAIFKDAKEARSIANKIQDVMFKVNDLLISTPFENQWLDKYLNVQNYGINVAMPVPQVESEGDIRPYLEKEKTKKLDQIKEFGAKEEARKIAKAGALNVTEQDIIDSWTDYIYANWEVDMDKAELRNMFSTWYGLLADLVKNKDFFDTYPCQRLHHAINTKAKTFIEKNIDSSVPAVTRAAKSVQERHDVEREVDKRFINNGKLHDILRSASHGFFDDFSPEYKGKFKAKSLNLTTPFKGVDFSYNEVKPLAKMLGQTGINASYVNQSYDLDSEIVALTSAFTNFIFEYGRVKQHASFKKELIAMAWELDSKPFHENILAVMDKTMPF